MQDNGKPFNRQERIQILRKSKPYRKAYQDFEFLNRDELRPLRLQLELMKPEFILKESNITSTIVCFGSARIWSKEDALARIAAVSKACRLDPKNPQLCNKLASVKRLLKMCKFYEIGREFGRIVAQEGQGRFLIVTGGGPGIMEAANRGAYEGGAKSIGLNITLPMEQGPNPYVSPEFAFRFHYFAIRKMHFMMRAKALVVYPGGFGTFDELFEALTLVQTGKKHHFPVILVGRKYWTDIINWDAIARYGVISKEDLKLFHFAETAREAWKVISDFYKLV
ncbi:MAG: TIGR00730 family Rossman fold protein [Elusimicrobiales bacterium]|nr:TIGR00730 family Rossman fold protein [Elusimicrobiales bacterium]